MTHEITTCLWFNNNGKEAAEYYQTIFPDFEPLSENPLAVNYRLMGRRFMHLNGGPGFPINPSISFFVNLEDEAQIEEIWSKLIVDGQILMDLSNYPWSPKYGWCSDKYGVNWQLMKAHESDARIIPNLMFCQHNAGKAEEAMDFYASLFPNSKSIAKSRYEKGEHEVEGYLKYSQTQLNGAPFCAMDSSMTHMFNFNEGVSFTVVVDTQEEIDFFWESLVAGGQEGKCGWLKDKYGVSWQIVPSILPSLMNNPETAPNTVYKFMQMTKLDIEKLKS
jgi:predicted 3-demethylubiquinone-9 3-methyltransferase (glyoxalase superfamily)